VSDNPRIDELRRRVQKDPASIAFAQLAEEHRRAGQYQESVRVCRAGLESHPTYLSARVTLGRALIELGQYDEAQTELEYVLRAAPENLAAIRGLADIHQRRGEPPHIEHPDAEPLHPAAHTPAGMTVGTPSPQPDRTAATAEPAGEWELETFTPVSTTLPDVDDALAEEQPHDPAAPIDPVVLDPGDQATLAELESWLEAIRKDREAHKARPR
jgi:tetratricopeptide (TPR) repeat protein